MNQQSNVFKPVIEELVGLTMNSNRANLFILGNLVAFLAEKGVIDLDEYLEFTKNAKDHIVGESKDQDEARLKAINTMFDIHLNDFKKE